MGGADHAQFLESNNLIDYSLLVGVHYTGQGQSQDFVEGGRYKPFHKRCLGGLLSADGKEIYYIGIIDFLTTYTLRKKGETFAKRLLLKESQVCANHLHLQ